jgi:pilus assembly protein CpaC
MHANSLIRAGLLGLALVAQPPVAGQAEDVLKIMQGSSTSSINVAMNRAIVMESETPFAELSVANPAIADIATLSDRTMYVLGKTPGRTTLTLLGPDGKLITNVDVRVTPDIAEFKERLKEILPNEPIEVRTANDGIVLSGMVSGKQKLALALELGERYAPQRVTNLMQVGGTQQVMLKVRFAEMQRSVAKNLSASIGLNDSGTGFNNSGFSVGHTISDVATGTVDGNSGAQIARSLTLGGLNVGVLLEALETKGLVRTLAEPNLVAVSGQQAKFLAGGEYPVPITDGTNVSVEYKPFGVELAFTPVVVDEDLISLSLSASVSSIDTTVTVASGTAFRRRETSTTVEMRDGQSFAIAGLLQDDFTDSINQLPWLGDIPILGALFRSTNYNRNQSELVIVVTAHLVTPVKGDSLSLPTDRVRIPSEAELFLLGKAGARSGQPMETLKDITTQDVNGAYGYVME